MLKSEVSKGSLLNEAVIEVCRCNRAPVDNPVPDQGTFLKNALDGFLAACKSRPIMGMNVTANNTVTRQMQSGTISQTGLFSGDRKKMTLILVFWQGF